MGWELDGAGRIKGNGCPAPAGQNNLIEWLTRLFYNSFFFLLPFFFFFLFAITSVDSACETFAAVPQPAPLPAPPSSPFFPPLQPSPQYCNLGNSCSSAFRIATKHPA